jgi:hypothetical protein
MIEFRPDWVGIWSVEEAEKELTGFKFAGPGFYHVAPDTMLVVPIERKLEEIWHSALRPGEKFRFYIWNGGRPIDVFNAIVNAPRR